MGLIVDWRWQEKRIELEDRLMEMIQFEEQEKKS